MEKPVPPLRDYTQIVDFPTEVTMTPIGVVRSPYTERHGTPRQPVVPGGKHLDEPATVVLDPARIKPRALNDLAGFDRVWLITIFHLNPHAATTVRPPRGDRRRGVLATRSPHHPNRIGLSAVRLERVEGLTLHLRGVDLIDGTPVLGVKPYVPYCDAFPDSAAGWVDEVSAEPTDTDNLG